MDKVRITVSWRVRVEPMNKKFGNGFYLDSKSVKDEDWDGIADLLTENMKRSMVIIKDRKDINS